MGGEDFATKDRVIRLMRITDINTASSNSTRETQHRNHVSKWLRRSTCKNGTNINLSKRMKKRACIISQKYNGTDERSYEIAAGFEERKRVFDFVAEQSRISATEEIAANSESRYETVSVISVCS